jgi:predicted nucleic acid-binding protein
LRVSFDTNVLVYAADRGAGPKHDAAVELLGRAAQGDCVLLLQSLAEFFHVTTRKGGLSAAVASRFVNDWCAVFPVHAADEAALAAAIAAVVEGHLAFWDAMIWAAARACGCRLLITEDMQDGRALRGVRFVNPFDPRNAGLLEAALPAGG